MKKLIILLTILLSGCATTTKEMQQVIVDSKTQKTYVFPSDKALEQCPELPELKGKKFSDLYKYGSTTIPEIYYTCSADKDELSDWIKNFKTEVEKNK